MCHRVATFGQAPGFGQQVVGEQKTALLDQPGNRKAAGLGRVRAGVEIDEGGYVLQSRVYQRIVVDPVPVVTEQCAATALRMVILCLFITIVDDQHDRLSTGVGDGVEPGLQIQIQFAAVIVG